MPDARQSLRQILATGETEKTLAALEFIFEKNGDQNSLDEVLLLANRFNQTKNNFNRGILGQADFNLENNRIASALPELIENVPQNAVFEIGFGVAPIRPDNQKSKANWEKWALFLGIFAAVAGVTGYTLRDVFKKQEAAPMQIPAAPIEKTEKPAEPIVKPEQKTAPEKPGKNSPNITVKDKAKVGNIITGDSNTINIKQDF